MFVKLYCNGMVSATQPKSFLIKTLVQLFTIILFFCSVVSAQQTDTTVINKDSIEKAVDDFLKMIDSAEAPKSYFHVGVGIGNNQFSLKNVALNTQQSSFNLSLSPTISYVHKSGFAIAYNNYISLGNGSLEIIQHSITPLFDYQKNKDVQFGFSYTKYFSRKVNSDFTTPYINDFFSYFVFTKTKYQPGVSLGYSTGSFNETFSLPLINRKDTATIGVKDFSLIPSLQRDFTIKGLGKKDYFYLNPSFMLLLASGKYEVQPSDQLLLNRPRLAQRIRNDFSENTKFNLQSLGLNLDATWYIGKFYVNPQMYFDYYLLGGTDKLSLLYTLQTGVNF